MTIRLKTIEKGQDHRRIQSSDSQPRRFDLELFVCELKQQAKRVTIAGNGLGTHVFLLQQVFNEELSSAIIRFLALRCSAIAAVA